MSLIKKIRLPVWFNLLSVASAAIILIWPLTLFSSLFVFDAPNSQQEVKNWLLFSALNGWPLIVVGMIYWGRFLYTHSRKKLAILVTATPLLCLLSLGYLFYQDRLEEQWAFSSYQNEHDVALVKAVIDGELGQIDTLFQHQNANLDVLNRNYHSPLVIAYKAQQIDSFAYLLELGAQPNLMHQTKLKTTVAGFILSDRNRDNIATKLDYLNLLISAGLDSTLANRNQSLFHLSAINSPEIMQMFLTLGVDYNIKLNWGTPLEHAILFNKWHNVTVLLKLPDIQITDRAIALVNDSITELESHKYKSNAVDNLASHHQALQLLNNLHGVKLNQ